MMWCGAYNTPMASSYEYEIPGDTVVKTTHYYIGDCERRTLREVDVRKWKCQEIVAQKAEGVDDRIYFWRKKSARRVATVQH